MWLCGTAGCLFIFFLWCLILINLSAASDTADHSLLETFFSYPKRNTIFSFSSYFSGLSSSASFAHSSPSADPDLSPLLFSECPHPWKYLHDRSFPDHYIQPWPLSRTLESYIQLPIWHAYISTRMSIVHLSCLYSHMSFFPWPVFESPCRV